MMTTEAIDKGYSQMYESLLPTIETLIRVRITHAESALRTSVGIAFLLLLAAVYLSIGIYYATIGSIQSLARSAHALAGGDLRERVDLGVRDELKQVGDSFNEMADGFSALLEERKKAEAALRDSEIFNRSLVEHLPQRIFVKDRNSVYLSCNKNFANDFGVTPEQVIGKDDFVFNPADLAEAYRVDDQEVMTRGTMKDIEEPYKLAGELRLARTIKVPYHDVNGQVIGVMGIFEDITERKQAEQSLSMREADLNRAQSAAHLGSWSWDIVKNYVFWSDELFRIFGVDPTNFVPSNANAENLLHPDDQALHRELVAAALSGERVGPFESRIVRPNGEERIVLASGFEPAHDATGRLVHLFGTILDITVRKLAERALIESRDKFHSVIDTAMDAMVQMDTEGIITGWNNQAVNMFGWSREEAIGHVLHQTIIPARYREAHVHGMKRFLASGEGAALNSRIEAVGLHRDGHEFPVELSITAIKVAGKYEFNGFIRDITQKKESDELIWRQANYDILTGLPNRRMSYDRMEQEIKKANRTHMAMALLFIDLDHFKEINDTLGHSMGDILLVEAARRLGECARELDMVARIGGDEFIILLSELDNTDSVERIAESIRQKLEEPFQLKDKVAYVSASIGIALYPNDATEIEYLLKDADLAMYISKKTGRNRISYFTAELQEAAQTRRQLINDLHGALAAKQFMVYYQPIVDLATGRINKAEALIRWQHPERGLVSPAEFIPLTEETGLIVEIGDVVFKEAANQAKHWRDMYNPEFQISVNMSPVQFDSAGSPSQTWPAYLQQLGLPGQSMVIEITEGLLLDAESGVTDKLLGFHNSGIQISLDDFGTGYSSLSYLKKFDMDYLKIDQSFTYNLAPGSSDMALSEAIIVMAHKLDLKVIAEGVETEAQRMLLAAAGCDYAQGYLYSRPVPAEEFEVLLKDNLSKS
jgi:diguanylate cyclase (GGDEF)-like protein/PAS domain S-box-containing protein